MIDFYAFASKFNRHGLHLDMLAQVAEVDEIYVNDNDKLVIRVTPLRNLDKGYPPDEYIFDQVDAKKYQLDKWSALPHNGIEQLEGRYIPTQSSAYRPVHTGYVKVFKPVFNNCVIIGIYPVEVSLLQHCTRNELQELLEQSIGQDEYERWINDQYKEYERVVG